MPLSLEDGSPSRGLLRIGDLEQATIILWRFNGNHLCLLPNQGVRESGKNRKIY